MLCILMVAIANFMVLFRVCLPMDLRHAVLFSSMVGIYFLGWIFFPEVFNLMRITDLTKTMLGILLVLTVCSVGIFILFIFLEKQLAKRGVPKFMKKLHLE